MDCSQPAASLHGILQERILERVTMLSSMDLHDSRAHTNRHTHSHTLTALCEPAFYLASVVLDSLQTLWTIVHQAPLSMGFSRKEYWRRLPCPPPGIFMMHTHTHTHTQTHSHTHSYKLTHTHKHAHTHTALSEPTGYLASVVLDSLQTL